MAGAVLAVVIVAIAAVLLVFGITAIFVVPLAVLALVAVFSVPLFGAIARGRRGGGGVPSTSDASYDPVAESQRDV